jgi:hypothetical protein
MRRANAVSLVAVGLITGFIAAVIVTKLFGDCWRNCDPEYDTVYSAAPMMVYFAAVGLSWAGLCGYLWTRPFCRAATRSTRLAATLVAGLVTFPLAAVLTRIVLSLG